MKTICEETELSERVVRRVISELENLSLLKVERRGEKHLVSKYWVTKQGCTTSTLRVHKEQAKGARRAGEGAPQAPQASRSPIETTRGNGNGYPRFPKELRNQIEDISKEIERLHDFGKTEEDKSERLRLIARKKELKNKYYFDT